MIKVRLIRNNIEKVDVVSEEDFPFELGKTLADFAPESALMAFVGNQRVFRADFGKIILADGETVVFCETYAGGIIGGIIGGGGMASSVLGGFSAIASLGRDGGSPSLLNFFQIGQVGQTLARGTKSIGDFFRGITYPITFLANAISPGLPALGGLGAGGAGGSGDSGGSQTYSFGQPTPTAGQGRAIPVVFGELQVAGQIVLEFEVADNATGDGILHQIIMLADGEINQWGIGEFRVNTDQNNLKPDLWLDVTAMSATTPVRITTSAPHGMEDGQIAWLINTGTSLNETRLFVTVVSATQLDLAGTSSGDASGFSASNAQVLCRPVPSGITINDQPARNFTDYSISFRKGSLGQSAVPLGDISGGGALNLDWTYQIFPRSYEFKNSRPFVHETQTFCTDVFVNVIFPNGVRSINRETGENVNLTVRFTVTVRKVSDNSVVQSFDFVAPAKRQGAFLSTIFINGLAPLNPIVDRYQITIQRVQPQADPAEGPNTDVYTANINTVGEFNRLVSNTYNGVAGIFITARATAQLSGGVPVWRSIIQGQKAAVWDDTREIFVWEYSNNPAWIIAALALSKRFGMGAFYDQNNLSITRLEQYADYCDELIPRFTGSSETEKRCEFNGVFEQPARTWEVILQVAASQRGLAFFEGDKIVVIPDGIRPTFQMFGLGNVLERGKKLEMSISYVENGTRPNIVEIEYLDREGWEKKTAVADFALDPVENLIQPLRQLAVGVTSPTQAARLAAFLLRRSRFPLRQLEMSTGADTIAVVPGDVVSVPASFLGRPYAGRIVSQTTSVYTLDQTIEVDTNTVYEMLIRDNEGNIGTLEFRPGSTSISTVSFGAGNDPVVGPANGYLYHIEPLGLRRNRFVVQQIRGVGQNEAQISGYEYIDDIYGDGTDTGGAGVFDFGAAAASSANDNVELTETYQQRGVSRIRVEWTPGTGSFFHDIWYRNNAVSTEYTLIANRATGASSPNFFEFLIQEESGTIIDVVVISKNRLNQSTSTPSTAPSSEKATLRLRRDDEANFVPPQVPNETGVTVSTVETNPNLYVASFTGFTTPVAGQWDGVEIRQYGWAGGARVAVHTTNADDTVQIDQYSQSFFLRRYRDISTPVGTKRYFSDDFLQLAIDGDDAYVTYTELDVDFPADGQDLWRNCQVINGSIVNTTNGYFGQSVIQVANLTGQPLEIIMPVLDAGSVASRLLSWDARVFPSRVNASGEVTELDDDFIGLPYENYFSRKVFLDASQTTNEFDFIDSPDVTTTELDDGDGNIVLLGPYFSNSRYARLRVQVSVDPDAPNAQFYRMLCLVFRMKLTSTP